MRSGRMSTTREVTNWHSQVATGRSGHEDNLVGGGGGIHRLAVALSPSVSRSPRLGYAERKCADTAGTVPVPRAGHFQC